MTQVSRVVCVRACVCGARARAWIVFRIQAFIVMLLVCAATVRSDCRGNEEDRRTARPQPQSRSQSRGRPPDASPPVKGQQSINLGYQCCSSAGLAVNAPQGVVSHRILNEPEPRACRTPTGRDYYNIHGSYTARVADPIQ